jgi:hypothetical protein
MGYNDPPRIRHDQMDDVRLLGGFHQQGLQSKVPLMHAHHSRSGARLEGSDKGGPLFQKELCGAFFLAVDRLQRHKDKNRRQDDYGPQDDPWRNIEKLMPSYSVSGHENHISAKLVPALFSRKKALKTMILPLYPECKAFLPGYFLLKWIPDPGIKYPSFMKPMQQNKCMYNENRKLTMSFKVVMEISVYLARRLQFPTGNNHRK